MNSLMPILNTELADNDLVSIYLGKLLFAVIFFFIAWKVSRQLIGLLNRRVLLQRIHDEDTRAWLVNFSTFLLIFISLVIALLIAGLKRNALAIIWNLTLFSIGSSNVDLGNIIIGLVFLYPGLRLSRYLTAEFRSIILSRLKIDEAAKSLIEKIVQYLLIILVFLFVMTIIGIPLTAFTVIGGALAIGFGLGSQNLVNNFLSGLILLIEHPVKVGDIVDVDSHKGTVEEIGARATRIKTFDNLRVIIPNSKLLENTFINWSLMDNLLRREINVGVAYGSDMDLAMQICRDIMNGDYDVEKRPEPLVIFSDFGDNSLNICMYYWITLSATHSPLLIESRLRSDIYRKFNESGIVIAFPQRDVHLETVKPLQIRLESDKNSDSEA